MIGQSAGRQILHCSFQILHRRDQLRILCRLVGEADDTDSASAANLAVFAAVCRFINNLDELFRPAFQIGDRTACHALGAIQNQHDVHRIACNIRLSRKGKGDFKCPPAVNMILIQFFVGICDTHQISFPFSASLYRKASYILCRRLPP